MNPELKAKWVEALRSGKYTQARGALHRKDGSYCCLGVLCSLKGMSDAAMTNNRSVYPAYALVGPDAAHDLSAMNDGIDGEVAHSFAEIADWIETHL